MRSICLNWSGTKGEPQGFHFMYHRLLDFAVLWVSDEICTNLNRAGQGHHESMCDVSILTSLGSENKPWALWNWMRSSTWRPKCGAGGRGCNFWVPFTCCSKKSHTNKQTNKHSLHSENTPISSFKIVLFLLLEDCVHWWIPFQFQLRRKVAAEIDAPECVQAEQLQDLDGRKLDAIRLSCACWQFTFLEMLFPTVLHLLSGHVKNIHERGQAVMSRMRVSVSECELWKNPGWALLVAVSETS